MTATKADTLFFQLKIKNLHAKFYTPFGSIIYVVILMNQGPNSGQIYRA